MSLGISLYCSILPVGGAEPADEAAVPGVDHGLREAGVGQGRGGNRRLLVGDGHRDRAEHDDAAGEPEQHAQGLAQRPVPPPAALDLDPGAVEPAPSRPGEPPGAPWPAGATRATTTAPAPTPPRRSAGSGGDYRPEGGNYPPEPSRGFRRPHATGGLVLPVQLRGFLGTRRWARRARVAAVMAAPGRAAVIGAHRGADTSAAGVSGQAFFVAVDEVSLGTAESLRVPARGVVAQVVVDVPCVAPIAPVGRRAPAPSRARVAIPNVKVISFAAHASSLVARRSPLAGMRPLPEGRARRPGYPPNTNVTSWRRCSLAGQCYRRITGCFTDQLTGWFAPAASGVRLARQCRERKR